MLPNELQRRVAQIDVLCGMVFPNSVAFWHCGDSHRKRWIKAAAPTKPILIGADDALEIDGDVNVKIDAPDGGILHISGDLLSDIEIGGHHEIVIGGNVASGCAIRTSGYSKVYVRGSFHGQICATGSSDVWVDGDFTGSIKTGTPSTKMHIAGDFTGLIAPSEKAALLWLSVDGYVESLALNSFEKLGYTQFHASVGTSDVPAGLYPAGTGHRKTDSGNSYSRWCVLSQR
jgi:hypothetical protein